MTAVKRCRIVCIEIHNQVLRFFKQQLIEEKSVIFLAKKVFCQQKTDYSDCGIQADN